MKSEKVSFIRANCHPLRQWVGKKAPRKCNFCGDENIREVLEEKD